MGEEIVAVERWFPFLDGTDDALVFIIDFCGLFLLPFSLKCVHCLAVAVAVNWTSVLDFPEISVEFKVVFLDFFHSCLLNDVSLAVLTHGRWDIWRRHVQ